jgi:hypothetical protein
LRDEDWELLLGRIESGNCTPFLGAGVYAGTLPLGSEIAEQWADRHAYPLEDRLDLARVAQFVGVDRDDAMLPKEEMCRAIAGLGPPDFSGQGEPHAVFARLPLPAYLTTNYDDFMVAALSSARFVRSPFAEPISPAQPSILRRDPEASRLAGIPRDC